MNRRTPQKSLNWIKPPFNVWISGVLVLSYIVALLVFLISLIYKGLFAPNIRDSVDT